MRTEIELKDQPVRARLYLTALGLVEAEINGAKVGNDALIPGWTNYEQRVEMWTYDVTENLSAGTNAMGSGSVTAGIEVDSASTVAMRITMVTVSAYSPSLKSNMRTAAPTPFIPTRGTADGRPHLVPSSALTCAKANVTMLALKCPAGPSWIR